MRISVIAVQGLDAHPYLLRGRRKKAQIDRLPEIARTASEAAETMWLRDFLPSFVPHAQIATYSYKSDWRRAEVKTGLRKCGEQLLNVLHQNQSNEKVSTTVLDTHPSLLRVLAGVSTTTSVYQA